MANESVKVWLRSVVPSRRTSAFLLVASNFERALGVDEVALLDVDAPLPSVQAWDRYS